MELDEIKELMALKEWTQGDLARQLGLTRNFIARWFMKDRHPSEEHIEKMRAWLKEARAQKMRAWKKQPA